MNIILLGSPGAGKDTLADQLVKQYNYTVLTPGAIYRKEANDNTELGIWARDNYWGKGLLCPDDITNKMMIDAYNKLENKDMVIFNGYPRTVEQSKYITEQLSIKLVLCLDVDEDIAMIRLLARGRSDDKRDIILKRFKEFNINQNNIKDFFLNLEGCAVVDIDANSSINRVFEFAFKNIINFVPHKK